MMMADFAVILYWWLILFGIGLVFLPLTFKIFGGFWDRGYAFSKILGLLSISYTVWLLGSLKILPFFRETILLAILGFAAFNLYSLKGSRVQGLKSLRVKIFIGEEVLFLVCLAFWAFIRGFQPDIQGLEKFMDFGFVNSILRSLYFPPADMWFAGQTINYYYFGHFVAALLTRLSGLDSAITYNLQLATIFALAFTATFSLASNLLYHIPHTIYHIRKVIFAGLLSAFLLTLGGNLHAIVYTLKDGPARYWYPDATRYIGYNPPTSDKTIHEFPIYSFVVSDLHGHVSDIPFVFLFLALTFILVISVNQRLNQRKSAGSFFKDFLPGLSPVVILLPLTLGVMYMTNSWDLPIYFMVLGATLLWLNYQKFGFTLKAIICTMLYVIYYMLLVVLFSLPFSLHFSQMAKGVDLVRAHSLPHQLFVLWGAPWFFCLTFLAFCFGGRLRAVLRPEFLIKKFASLLQVKVRLLKNQLRIADYELTSSDFFILILIAVATFLIVIPEILYVKDIYIPEYHRANTMFKLVYQSFMMYSLAAGYIIIRVLASFKGGGLSKKFLVTCYMLFVACLMIYPYFAIKSYYGSLKNYQGLYGLNFLKRSYPDNYQAILWFNREVSGQPVILEAVGDSYTDYNQISMVTGLPTVEGWLVHEWLWRGSFDEPGKRAGEVQQIYEGDLTAAKNLLGKYKVEYVIVGQLERQKYPNLNETKFSGLGKLVFSSGATKIFKIEVK